MSEDYGAVANTHAELAVDFGATAQGYMPDSIECGMVASTHAPEHTVLGAEAESYVGAQHTVVSYLATAEAYLPLSAAYRSFSAAVSAGSISQSYQLALYHEGAYAGLELGLDRNYSASLLGKSFGFKAAELRLQNELWMISAESASDPALTAVNVWTTATELKGTVESVLSTAAAKLGKTLICNLDSYNVRVDTTASSFTELLSTCISWLGEMCPHLMINCWVDGDTIYCVQRGHESRTVSIDGHVEAYPEYSWAKVNRMASGGYTEFSGVTVTEADTSIHTVQLALPTDSEYQTSSRYRLSGTYSFGEHSLHFDNGYLTRETHGDNSTSWNIADGRYQSMTEEDKTYRTVTSYTYSNGKLVQETRKQYKLEDSSLQSTTYVHHYPIGGGFWATATEEDGEQTGFSIGQGAAYGDATRYEKTATLHMFKGTGSDGVTITSTVINEDTDEEVSIAQRVQWITNFGTKGTEEYYLNNYITGTYSGQTDLPLSASAVKSYVAKLAYIEGRTQESLSCTVYGVDYIGLDSTVSFGGNIYYVESAQLTHDSSGVKQALQLVRWT